MKKLWSVCLLSIFAASASLGYELPSDLRQRVDELTSAVLTAPTSLDNAEQRAAVLWQWANAII